MVVVCNCTRNGTLETGLSRNKTHHRVWRSLTNQSEERSLRNLTHHHVWRIRKNQSEERSSQNKTHHHVWRSVKILLSHRTIFTVPVIARSHGQSRSFKWPHDSHGPSHHKITRSQSSHNLKDRQYPLSDRTICTVPVITRSHGPSRSFKWPHDLHGPSHCKIGWTVKIL